MPERAVTRPSAWHGGWWRLAQVVSSPNHGQRPPGVCIDTVVIHSISLPPGQYGGTQVLDFFTNQLDWGSHPYFEHICGVQVSAHFFIQRTGQVIQCVSTGHRAWHAGVSEWLGRPNVNDFSLGIELEGLEGESFMPAQYASLTSLCQALQQEYPLTYIVGHEHIAPGRKGDPGSGFDWPHLATCLNWGFHDVAGLHRPSGI